MRCPQDIADLVTEILQTGLLRIRAAAWEGNAERCAAEADHLHNLPELLRNYSPAKLQYYWDVERTSFLARLHALGDSAQAYAPLWQRLSSLVDGASSMAVKTALEAP